MLGGRKIRATLTGETLEGSVAKCCPESEILLPRSSEAWSQMNSIQIEGCGNTCYTLGYALSSSANNSQIFFRRLWVWNTSGVIKLSYQSIHKGSAPDHYLTRMCGNTAHIQQWPVPHNSSSSSLWSTYCSFHHAGWQLAPESNYERLICNVTN